VEDFERGRKEVKAWIGSEQNLRANQFVTLLHLLLDSTHRIEFPFAISE
jgi:hypothetical protein